MKAFITCLLLAALLLGIVFPLSFAQQNRTLQKPDPEIEGLKNRILILESKLQTVENTKKMELEARLADANAKLADAQTKLLNAEIDKYTGKLKDTNDEWLMKWNGFFIGVLAVIGVALWFSVKSLIANRIEKSLDGFKEAMTQVNTLQKQLAKASDQVNTLQNQIRILEKEHAVSVLENSPEHYLKNENHHTEQIKALREEVLLQVFEDETRLIEIRCGAADVLAVRKSPLLVSPMLKFLNSVVDSDFDWIASFDTQRLPYRLLSSYGHIHTLESYEGLEQFLNRLLTENPKHKNLFLAWTAFYLAGISIELKIDNSVSVMKKAIPDLKNSESLSNVLSMLVKYFDTFNEPEGIKEMLTNGLTERMPEVEEQCLELLPEQYSDFVRDWKARKETPNTQTEESA